MDADPLLRRLERRAFVFCVLAAAAALVLRRGSPDVALGVAGGGLLIGLSYWAIRSSIDGLLAMIAPAPGARPDADAAEADPGARRRRAIGYVLRFTSRYAVLGVLAYLMLAHLDLHPVGLVVGVSSIVAAAALEAAQGLRPRGRGPGADPI